MLPASPIRREPFDDFRVAFSPWPASSHPRTGASQRVDLELPLAEVNTALERLIRTSSRAGQAIPRRIRRTETRGRRRAAWGESPAIHARRRLGLLPAIGFRWADAVRKTGARPTRRRLRLERDDWQGRTSIQARIASLARRSTVWRAPRPCRGKTNAAHHSGEFIRPPPEGSRRPHRSTDGRSVQRGLVPASSAVDPDAHVLICSQVQVRSALNAVAGRGFPWTLSKLIVLHSRTLKANTRP